MASWAAAASAHGLQPCLRFLSRFLAEVRQGGLRNEVVQMWPVEQISKERRTSCSTIWLAEVSWLFFGDAAGSFVALFGAEVERFLSQTSLIWSRLLQEMLPSVPKSSQHSGMSVLGYLI